MNTVIEGGNNKKQTGRLQKAQGMASKESTSEVALRACFARVREIAHNLGLPSSIQVRACLNVLIESVHKICRQNLSKIKLCDWPNKLDATSWQVLNTTESVEWTDSN